MIIHGDRLVLRPLTEADLDAVLAILREPEVARWWGDYDAERARGELLKETETLAIDVDGEVAGVLMVSEENDPDYRHATLDISLATRFHNHGLFQRR